MRCKWTRSPLSRLSPKFRHSLNAINAPNKDFTLWAYILFTYKSNFFNSVSSYLVKRGFSSVASLLIKQRNKLEMTGRGDLRLSLSNLKLHIKNLL